MRRPPHQNTVRSKPLDVPTYRPSQEPERRAAPRPAPVQRPRPVSGNPRHASYEARRRAIRARRGSLWRFLPIAAFVILLGAAVFILPRAFSSAQSSGDPLAVTVVPGSGRGIFSFLQRATPTPEPTIVPIRVAPTGPSNGPFPILMYHYVRDVDEASDPLGYGLSMSPAAFAEQMNWLKQNGYSTLRMDEFTACVTAQVGCPERSVALTFDDGYTDALSAVFPVLKQHGFTATFYVINSRVGQPGYLSWGELTELQNAGMEIGAHTIDHFNLTDLDPAESLRQMTESKQGIESALGVAVTSFCYPAGRYDDAIVQQVAQAGYTNATTTRWDNDYSSLLRLPRRRMSGGMSLEQFVAAVQ